MSNVGTASYQLSNFMTEVLFQLSKYTLNIDMIKKESIPIKYKMLLCDVFSLFTIFRYSAMNLWP